MSPLLIVAGNVPREPATENMSREAVVKRL